MPRTYNEGLIACPFYKSMGLKSITCEGITEDCDTKLLFTSTEARDKHRSIFCNKKYGDCEICRMLEQKYEE